MANYTGMTVLRGEIFTKDNPAFVEILNELEIPEENFNNIVEVLNKNHGKSQVSLDEIKNQLNTFEFDSLLYVLKINNTRLNDLKDIIGNQDDYPDKAVLAKLNDLEEKIQVTNDKLDGTLNTQVIGSIVEQMDNGIETITYQRQGEAPEYGGSETLFDLPNIECELLSFSMGANSDLTQIRISFYKENGVIDGNLRIAKSDGSGLVNPTAGAIQKYSAGENDFWAIRVYDTDTKEFVVTMKRPLIALNGMRITLHAWDHGEQFLSVNAAVAKRRKGE